jgi:hypothetical protein
MPSRLAGFSNAFWYVTTGPLMVLVMAMLELPAPGEVGCNQTQSSKGGEDANPSLQVYISFWNGFVSVVNCGGTFLSGSMHRTE